MSPATIILTFIVIPAILVIVDEIRKYHEEQKEIFEGIRKEASHSHK